MDKGGKLIAGSDSIAGAWEAFHIEKVGDTTNDNVATFYENSNYGGWSVSLPEGTYNYRDIIAKGIKNDAISSLKVNSGYKVTLYNDAGFNGTSKAFTGDASYVGDENE